jgi:hypothetical protein
MVCDCGEKPFLAKGISGAQMLIVEKPFLAKGISGAQMLIVEHNHHVLETTRM